jgi:hypothetical protein
VYASIEEKHEDVRTKVPELFDTEAPQPQTRQLVKQLLPLSLHMCDTDEYTGQTELESGDAIWERGEGYTTVTRGIKWLVECAFLRLPDGVPLYTETRKSLQKLLTPQPKYDSSRDWKEPTIYEDYNTVITAVQPAFRLFTIWPRSDEASIECQVDVVMSIALDVAAIFERQPQPRLCLPPYIDYIVGFIQARARFKAAVEATSSSRTTRTLELPYHVRAALKVVKFSWLWNALWLKAAGGDNHLIADQVYEAIVKDFAKIENGSNSNPIDMKALMRRMWKIGRLRFRTPKEIAESLLPLSARDIRSGEGGGIPKSTLYAQNIGRRLYDSRSIRAFWTANVENSVAAPSGVIPARHAQHMQTGDEADTPDDYDEEEMDEEMLHDCYTEAYLEAFGPYVRPLDHSAWDLDSPEDQCCVVCLETHGFISVKMSACGHYFHLACIKEWLNQTSPNANLCPECRTQICRERQKVRFLGWMDDDGDEDEDDDTDNEADESDGSDEDEIGSDRSLSD